MAEEIKELEQELDLFKPEEELMNKEEIKELVEEEGESGACVQGQGYGGGGSQGPSTRASGCGAAGHMLMTAVPHCNPTQTQTYHTYPKQKTNV